MTGMSRSNSSTGNRLRQYCSKVCWGIYAGKHYGWGSPTTYLSRRRYPRDREALIKLLGGEEFTSRKMQDTFGYTDKTIDGVLKQMIKDKIIEYNLLDKYRIILQ
jgi:hypothetical protein